MKYILFTMVILLNLTGCGKDSDPDPTNPDPKPTTATPASEECKMLETIHTAYNKFLTCIDADTTKFIDIKPGTQCVTDFKEPYETLPAQITEQMNYFPYFYSLFDDLGVKEPPVQTKPTAGQTQEESLQIQEGLKPYPFHLCWYKKLEHAYSLSDLTELTNKDEEYYGKQCFKELGEKAYQENKAKFNCK